MKNLYQEGKNSSNYIKIRIKFLLRSSLLFEAHLSLTSQIPQIKTIWWTLKKLNLWLELFSSFQQKLVLRDFSESCNFLMKRNLIFKIFIFHYFISLFLSFFLSPLISISLYRYLSIFYLYLSSSLKILNLSSLFKWSSTNYVTVLGEGAWGLKILWRYY